MRDTSRNGRYRPGVDLMTTSEVSEEAEVSETEARDWAEDNGVQRIGNAFAWTPQDVSDFLDDLDDLESELEEDD